MDPLQQYGTFLDPTLYFRNHRQEISRYQQGTLDISSYFTHLTTLWEELENFRTLKDCSCVIPCTSGVASDLKRHKEQDKVIKFLKGLNE